MADTWLPEESYKDPEMEKTLKRMKYCVIIIGICAILQIINLILYFAGIYK